METSVTLAADGRAVIAAAEVYPHALPHLRHNEAHRLIRRSMERGGEVVAEPGGFVWRDDTWFADASVSVISAEDSTAVTVHVERRRETLACILGTPVGGAAAGLFVAVQVGFGALVLPFAGAGLVFGIPAGILLERWSRNRWRRRAWATVEALGPLVSGVTDG